jgi:hypothetical protein
MEPESREFFWGTALAKLALRRHCHGRNLRSAGPPDPHEVDAQGRVLSDHDSALPYLGDS